MAESIANLWPTSRGARRLYNLYLCRLMMNDLHERIVFACRRIRYYANRGPGAKEGLFTFSYEIDALCDLKNYRGAWRQLRRRDEIVHGERFDVARREWSPSDCWDLSFNYSPLLYLQGRYRLGCSLLETGLGFWFGRKKVRSFDFLFHVHNDDKEPWHRCRVTLTHFYRRLGKDLSEWQHWPAFVKGFPLRLFELARVGRDELLRDAGRLPAFVNGLRAVQDERITSGVTWGLADLLDSPEDVRKRQEETQRQREESEEEHKPIRERLNAKLERLFPELRGLPR